jgi:hypothetical protein
MIHATLGPKRLMKRLFVLVLVTVTASGWQTACAQIDYTADGSPTGLEEEIRWRVNRGRFDSAKENQARGTAYADVPTSAGPLAPTQSLTLAARHHSEDMARNNVFQHATVPGSAYYNPTTQSTPWARMTAEGYSWNSAGENIAAGYSDGEAVYVGWWNSTGHRQNMYNSGLREIGNGYYYWSASSYGGYYTMDLGSSGNMIFFTDTLFNDSNGNGRYDQGEGVEGLRITLFVNGRVYTNSDTATIVGSFAIPIQPITAGTSVQVVLSNTTAAQVALSIPLDYQTSTAVTLPSHQARAFGSFARPTNVCNIGWRNVLPAPPPIIPPALSLARAGQDMVLRWPSDPTLDYLPQRSTNLFSWSNVTTDYLAGTGTNMSFRHSAITSSNRQSFYRLLIRSH